MLLMVAYFNIKVKRTEKEGEYRKAGNLVRRGLVVAHKSTICGLLQDIKNGRLAPGSTGLALKVPAGYW